MRIVRLTGGDEHVVLAGADAASHSPRIALRAPRLRNRA
jgi:hypothetical protein